MTTTYTWTTARGAKVEMTVTVEHITTKTVSADGWTMEIKCDEWARNVESCTVNGKPTALKQLWDERGTDCIMIGKRGNDRILAALPANVAEAIYGEERKANEEKLARAIEVEKKVEAHREMMRKAMSY